VLVQGQIGRNLVADMVFKDPSLLHQLEQILHPEVAIALEKAYKNAHSLFVAEIPLLFEAGFDTFFDYTIAVTAEEKTCLDRFMSRGLSREDFYRRRQRQLPEKELTSRANFIITNRGSLSDLKQEVDTIINQLGANIP
jgi:dephospho-CoA kinase